MQVVLKIVLAGMVLFEHGFDLIVAIFQMLYLDEFIQVITDKRLDQVKSNSFISLLHS